MNKTVPTGRIETKNRSKLRAIEQGKYGKVTDVVIIARYIHPEHGVCSSGVHFGTQTVEGVSYMVDRYSERLKG